MCCVGLILSLFAASANAALVKEINDEGPKRLTLEQEARQLLQRSTQAEIKGMILKH